MGYFLYEAKVHEVFRYCRSDRSAPLSEQLIVHGISVDVVFNRQRIEHVRQTVAAMLRELPLQFIHMYATGCVGVSFLEAYVDRTGKPWTESADTVEQLFMLGMAIGAVSYVLPRPTWDALPECMPYLMVSFSPRRPAGSPLPA